MSECRGDGFVCNGCDGSRVLVSFIRSSSAAATLKELKEPNPSSNTRDEEMTAGTKDKTSQYELKHFLKNSSVLLMHVNN